MSREETEILKWFKHQACEEQRLLTQISGLTDQVNGLTRNVNNCISQLHQKQQNLNAANHRLKELEQALTQSERSRAICENELQHEQSTHASTKDYLAQEFAQHHRAESTLARQSQAMRNLSEFLTLMQGTSERDKGDVVHALASRDDMGMLMMELEDKKQAFAELEEQRKQELAQFEGTTNYLREHCLKHHQQQPQAYELDSRMEAGATSVSSTKKRKSRRGRTQRNDAEGGTPSTFEAEAQVSPQSPMLESHT
ncbi:MAG: hypothetical protein LQ350_007935 [Teloschistes chrysophthalmus]|nr:MAG: hypothetical protein LQ350_007935 [Niorma chrysophthalma]